jgi:cell surface protein SprA
MVFLTMLALLVTHAGPNWHSILDDLEHLKSAEADADSPAYTDADAPEEDSTKAKNPYNDSLKFKLEDRAQDKITENPPAQFDLKDPSNLKTEVTYEPDSPAKYTISEKIGNEYYRAPTYMTFEEYMAYKAKKDEEAYFKKRQKSLSQISKKGGIIPKVNLGNALFDRIFGGTGIEVKPQGNVDLSFGGNWQNIKNPMLVQSAQRYGIFDFDMNMNISLMAKIGDKMRFNFAYNSRATFDFENQLKLDYAGQEDDIIKKLEAGYISFPLKTQLIQGVQSLFGIKADLQFGRLRTSMVASQQRSKRESISFKNGSQTQNVNITCDNYEDFRHFLVSHTFRRNYNNALSKFPIISSLNNINRMEVWVTNRNGAINDARDVVAFMDLGEPYPKNPNLTKASSDVTDNNSNTLYQQLNNTQGARSIGTVVNALQNQQGLNLQGRIDFEKTFARKLNPTEYTFHPQLGMLSLNTQLQPDDVVGIAFEYTNNGKVYQVGEFAQNLPPDSTNPKVLFLKMLKSTSPDPTVPLWDLMMKNVYSLGAAGVSQEDFQLNVMYLDPGGGEKRYLPEGPKAGIPLLNLLNLDRLNNQNDPQPDGRFDYVEGITINSQNGKIIFPVLEPFGEDLRSVFNGDKALERKYLYTILYDSTKNIAMQFPQYNRFVLKGTYKSSTSSEIYLGGFNIPQGSVTVTAGGTLLTENVDYSIDYGIGKLRILNSGVLSSGIPINVSYENNATFGIQQQNFIGTRLDYFVNDHINFGGTLLRLSERPFFNKVTFGEDPIKNTVLGLDGSYQADLPSLTRRLDKLPLLSTTAPSLINAQAEVAKLIPGHSRLINGPDGESNIYIDDFEGTRSGYDLKFPVMSWALASTPQDAKDQGGNELFREAKLVNDLNYGKNRAKLMWYNLDPCLVDPKQGCMPENLNDTAKLSNHYLRLIQQQEVFPLRSYTSLQGNLTTLDLAYYPKERGPYNFDATDVDSNGKLKFPTKRWAGIMRPIDFSDFETANVEFIEFWLLDPFINRPAAQPGSLYLNLGNISEDILRDSRKFFENGLPYPADPGKVEPTVWSKIPKFQQQLTPAFDNNPDARAAQDVGLDGMANGEELTAYQPYLTQLQNNFGANSKAYQDAVADPSNDDYHHFRGDDYDNAQLGVFERYRKFNNPQGNSPVTDNNTKYSNAFTNVPESEDINRDNSLNENEQYFQYRIDIKPNMQVGSNFIINRQDAQVTLPNRAVETQTWYQFKVPIREFTDRIGGIPDFRSIRFMRMFLTGFNDSVILRFGRLELGRNTWRRYNFSLKNPGELVPIADNNSTLFNLTSVSIEENSNRSPVPYVSPPGIQRVQQQVANGQNVLNNEQAISMFVCGLEDGDSRAAFKSLGMDMRQFKRMRMFIHAEGVDGETPLKDKELRAFIRLGSDFVANYYEYQIPLKLTLPGSGNPYDVWPEANNLDIQLDDLIAVKQRRNATGANFAVPYEHIDSKGNIIRVVGNPNLGDVQNAMLGILNPAKGPNNPTDDGGKKCGEVWFNELRLSEMNEDGGYAATAKLDLQLADFATIKASGLMHTAGYGNIDQKVNQRFRDNYAQYDVSANVNLGKLTPKDWGVQLPVFVGYSQQASNPIFDPYDKDVLLENKLKDYNASERDSIRKAAQDFTSIKSVNFQNVRIAPTKNKSKDPWDLQNFDLSYAYTQTVKHNPLIENDQLDEHAASFGYTYAVKAKSIEPFKKLIPQKRKYYQLIRDINFNFLPANFTVRNNLLRTIGETKVRNIDEGNYPLPINYFKFFTWNRTYSLRWDLTKSLSFDYSANNQSRIDEPIGRIDTKAKKDTFWNNVKRLGRNTHFGQTFNANYNAPLNKFPLLDWTTLRGSYGATYDWTAASLLAKSLGNTIGNTQSKQVNGELNFSQLYNKVKILRIISQPKKSVGKGAPSGGGKGGPDKKGGADDRKSEPDRNGRGGSSDRRDSGGGRDITGGGRNSGGGDLDNPDRSMNDPDSDKKKEEEKTADNNSSTGKNDKKKDEEELQKVVEDQKKKLKDKNSAMSKANKESKVDSVRGKNGKMVAVKKKRKKKEPNPSVGVRILGNALMMVKRVTFNYTENQGSLLPGYMDSTRVLGINNEGAMNPGIPFAFGYQPDRYWLEAKGRDNVLTRDSLFNANFNQSFTQSLDITANLEPFKDFKIDFNIKKSFNKAHTELFKDTIGGTNDYIHLNPYETGGFSISYIGLGTMFQARDKTTNLTKAFLDFENNRQVISSRLGLINPYTNNQNAPEDEDYKKGYTRYSQEVLIPAFLSAYRGEDPKTFPLVSNENSTIRSNPFRNMLPLPNWRVNYNGLSRTKAFKDIFQNFTLSHAYSGTMSMNSFNSSLLYRDQFALGFPSFIDSVSHNYIPYFMVPNMTINETLGPLIGIDATFKSSLNIKVEIKKSRTLSMSLVDYQLSETKSKEIIVGGGYRLKNVTINTPYFGLNKKKSDVNIKMDFSIRDDYTTINRLDQRESRATRGQKVISISPSVDYLITQNLTLRFFYDRRQSIPYVSNAFPITTTRGGVMFRFMLGQ